jgi:hypothetical protein
MVLKIKPTVGAFLACLQPGLRALAVEDVLAGEPLDNLIYVILILPEQNPERQMVQFWEDLVIFIFCICLEKRELRPSSFFQCLMCVSSIESAYV